jgi:hypothetical protein
MSNFQLACLWGSGFAAGVAVANFVALIRKAGAAMKALGR